MKLAIVGGGSTYTPELIDGLARLRDVLPLAEITLIDPDRTRLEVVGGMAARMLARYGHAARLRTTPDVRDGVEGADAVLLQLRIGGQSARRVDESLPLECGCVGQETTGAGGLAKALRTVPVVLEIAAAVAEHAPDAWLIDFTNPVGIVTRALLDAGHRAVGLCNVAIGFERQFARLLGVPRVSLGHFGLNHLTWERSVEVDGRDVLPELLDRHGDEIAAKAGAPLDLMRRLGVVPSYYLRYFYAHDEVVAQQRENPTRAEEVAAVESELLALYADPSVDTKPDLLTRRGGAFYSDAAVALLAALLRGEDDVQVVNLRNGGTMPFLPPEAVIEVPARVGPQGVEPVPMEPVPPPYAGLIAHVAAYEELAVEAARYGGADRVYDALLAHPLIGQTALAERLTAGTIAANRTHLPWVTS